MLANKPVSPALPAADLQRARQFYEEKLGLKTVVDDPIIGLVMQAGEGSVLYLYKSAATRADYTVAQFQVDNLEKEAGELRARGAVFEDYDLPDMGIKTVNGIARMSYSAGEIQAAWFKDSEGNLLVLVEVSRILRNRIKSKMAGAQA